MDFKFCLLSAGLLARHAHACPKVTVSRLVGDDGGRCTSRLSESHSFQANTSDDGGIREMAEKRR